MQLLLRPQRGHPPGQASSIVAWFQRSTWYSCTLVFQMVFCHRVARINHTVTGRTVQLRCYGAQFIISGLLACAFGGFEFRRLKNDRMVDPTRSALEIMWYIAAHNFRPGFGLLPPAQCMCNFSTVTTVKLDIFLLSNKIPTNPAFQTVFAGQPVSRLNSRKGSVTQTRSAQLTKHSYLVKDM